MDLREIDAEIEAALVDDDLPMNPVARALMSGPRMQHHASDPVALALMGNQVGAFAPTAPRPGDPPPPAELRAYNPSPSESAAFHTRQGAGALGIPSTLAERLGSGVGAAVGFLTPLDDVYGAIQSGAASDAALAGFSLIPGFRGGRKAAEDALPALRKEVEGLMGHYASLTGKSRPLPAGFEPAEKQVEGLNELKAWLTREIETTRAALPQARGTVPVTSSPQQEEVLRFLWDNPHTQAVPGRRGFPSKAEQERLVREFFQGGGQMPPAPWGHTRHSAIQDVRRIMGEAYAKGRRVSPPDQAAIENAARKVDETGQQLETLRDLWQRAEGSAYRGAKEIGELQRQLDRAEAQARHWQEQYQGLWKRLFGAD